MKKLSKRQKKWIAYFHHSPHHSIGGIYLLVFLFKLKVLDKITFIECKDIIMNNVQLWSYLKDQEALNRRDRNKTKAYSVKAPKSIKPTRARS